MFEETVGLKMSCCMLLYLILHGEGFPHKTVANALAGHQSGSQTIFSLTAKKSLTSCSLAEFGPLDEKCNACFQFCFFSKFNLSFLIRPLFFHLTQDIFPDFAKVLKNCTLDFLKLNFCPGLDREPFL